MAQKIDAIKSIAERMISSDRERDAAFRAYQDMYHLSWNAPEGLAKLQWMRAVISQDPADAIDAGTRVLSNLGTKIHVQPLRSDAANKGRANDIETNLLWQLKGANRRRSISVEADAVKSALLYMSVACQVIDLDWQMGQLEDGMDRTRLEIIRRYGRFMVNTYNPRFVHVQRSGIMPERVLLCDERPAQSVMDEWGPHAKRLKSLAEEGKAVRYYDYFDYGTRAVWCEAGDTQVILPPSDHGLDFMPWVALMGGSTLESDPQHQFRGMFYSIYESGAWENLNVAETLNFSEVIARAAAPRGKKEGPNPDTVTVDYGEPNQTVDVPAGDTYTPLPPPQIDQATLAWADRLRSGISQSTVSRVLMNGDMPSGTAFAAMNLATQTAVGALKPGKELAEKALAEVFTLMLLWCRHSKEPLVAYGTDKRNNLGKEYVIQPDEIDPTAIYIEAELTPDDPTDRQQRANTATMLVQWGFPKERALESVGVTDPDKALREWYLEKYKDALFNQEIQKMQASLQLQVQQAGAAMQAAQAQAQQAAQAQAASQQAAVMQGGGMGNNPAEGGMPPAMNNPNMTREMMTGADRSGNPLAGGGA